MEDTQQTSILISELVDPVMKQHYRSLLISARRLQYERINKVRFEDDQHYVDYCEENDITIEDATMLDLITGQIK